MRSISGPWSMVGARLRAVGLCVTLGCASTEEAGQPSRAVADTVATLFDSLSAIHSGRPDTGLLRRLHPPADTIHFVEGTGIESFTGDSLFRRVMVAHRPVSAAALPRPGFHAYLRRLVDAGFARNIMYGSDQAVWPAIIPYSIEAIDSADFLSPEQKRAILCGNAARFLRLDLKLCEG